MKKLCFMLLALSLINVTSIKPEEPTEVLKSETTQKIKLYIYPKCPYCKKVIQFLKDNNVFEKITLINANKPHHYQALKEISKKDICPYLHDEVHNRKMGESSRIIQYFKQLFKL